MVRGSFVLKNAFLLLDFYNVRRFWAFVGLHDFEFHGFSLREGLESISRDGGKMNENISGPVIFREKPITLLIAEPFHFAFHSLCHLFVSIRNLLKKL